MSESSKDYKTSVATLRNSSGIKNFLSQNYGWVIQTFNDEQKQMHKTLVTMKKKAVEDLKRFENNPQINLNQLDQKSNQIHKNFINMVVIAEMYLQRWLQNEAVKMVFDKEMIKTQKATEQKQHNNKMETLNKSNVITCVSCKQKILLNEYFVEIDCCVKCLKNHM